VLLKKERLRDQRCRECETWGRWNQCLQSEPIPTHNERSGSANSTLTAKLRSTRQQTKRYACCIDDDLWGTSSL